MPNIKSVKKDVVRSRQRQQRNQSYKSRMKTMVKKTRAAIMEHSVDEAQIWATESTIDKLAQKDHPPERRGAPQVSFDEAGQQGAPGPGRRGLTSRPVWPRETRARSGIRAVIGLPLPERGARFSHALRGRRPLASSSTSISSTRRGLSTSPSIL